MKCSRDSSREQLKAFERDYDLIIRQDFDEMTYQIEKCLEQQNHSYKKIRQLFFKHRRHSSDSDEGEIDSRSSSDSENHRSNSKNKRLKSHQH